MNENIDSDFNNFASSYLQTKEMQEYMRQPGVTSDDAKKVIMQKYQGFKAMKLKKQNPPVTQVKKPNIKISETPVMPKSGIAQIIEKNSQNIDQFNDSQSIGDQNKSTQNMASLLAQLGYNPLTKKQAVLKALISGIGSIAASAAHDPEASQRIISREYNDQAREQMQKSEYQKALLGLTKSERPATIREFDAYWQMGPEQQQKFLEYLRAKGDPLKNVLSGIIDGGN